MAIAANAGKSVLQQGPATLALAACLAACQAALPVLGTAAELLKAAIKCRAQLSGTAAAGSEDDDLLLLLQVTAQ